MPRNPMHSSRHPAPPIITNVFATEHGALVHFKTTENLSAEENLEFKVLCIESRGHKIVSKSPARFTNLKLGKWYTFVCRCRTEKGVSFRSRPSDAVTPLNLLVHFSLLEVTEELKQAEKSVRSEDSVTAKGVTLASSLETDMINSERARKETIDRRLVKRYAGNYPLEDFPKLRSAGNFARRNYIHKMELKKSFLSYTDRPLPRSLTRLDVETFVTPLHYHKAKKDCLELFDYLLQFGSWWLGDRSQSLFQCVRQIVVIVLAESRLTEEMICQFLKQTNGCPEALEIPFLKLLYVFVASVALGEVISLIVFDFICTSVRKYSRPANDTEKRKQEIAHRLFDLWQRSREQKPETRVPSDEELRVIFNEVKLFKESFYLPDMTKVTLKIARRARVKDVVREIFAILKLNTSPKVASRYTIVAYTNSNKFELMEDPVAKPRQVVLNFKSSWVRLQRKYPYLRFKLVVMKNTFLAGERALSADSTPPPMVHMAYHQAILTLVKNNCLRVSTENLAYLIAIYYMVKDKLEIKLDSLKDEKISLFLHDDKGLLADKNAFYGYKVRVYDEIKQLIDVLDDKFMERQFKTHPRKLYLDKVLFLERMFLVQLESFSVYSNVNQERGMGQYKEKSETKYKVLEHCRLLFSEKAIGLFSNSYEAIVESAPKKISNLEVNKEQMNIVIFMDSVCSQKSWEVVFKTDEFERCGKMIGEFMNNGS